MEGGSFELDLKVGLGVVRLKGFCLVVENVEGGTLFVERGLLVDDTVDFCCLVDVDAAVTEVFYTFDSTLPKTPFAFFSILFCSIFFCELDSRFFPAIPLDEDVNFPPVEFSMGGFS